MAGLCRGLLRGLIRRAGPTLASPIAATPAGRANGALAPPERMRGDASSRGGRWRLSVGPSACWGPVHRPPSGFGGLGERQRASKPAE